MKALIIDDEENARRTLKSFLAKFCPDVKIIGEAEGVTSGLEIINSRKFDILFLDIDIKEGTGFDLIHLVDQIDFDIIFTTAHGEYAIQAFRCAALDYLLKPINPLELKEAVDRSASNSHGLLEEKLIVASDSFNNKKLDKITLSSAEEIHWVNVEQIVRCQSFKNYSDVYMDGSKKITVTKTLKEIEELLPKDVFFRAHQSHLINLHYVDKYVKRDIC